MAVKALFPSKQVYSECTTVMWPTVLFTLSTFFFRKIVILFFAPGWKALFWKWVNVKRATATSPFPDTTTQQLDFNFQGKLSREKRALATQTASVCSLSIKRSHGNRHCGALKQCNLKSLTLNISKHKDETCEVMVGASCALDLMLLPSQLQIRAEEREWEDESES